MDGGGLATTVPLIVHVLDINDETPVFQDTPIQFVLSQDMRNFTERAFIKVKRFFSFIKKKPSVKYKNYTNTNDRWVVKISDPNSFLNLLIYYMDFLERLKVFSKHKYRKYLVNKLKTYYLQDIS